MNSVNTLAKSFELVSRSHEDSTRASVESLDDRVLVGAIQKKNRSQPGRPPLNFPQDLQPTLGGVPKVCTYDRDRRMNSSQQINCCDGAFCTFSHLELPVFPQ